jgi:hypothetical protein
MCGTHYVDFSIAFWWREFRITVSVLRETLTLKVLLTHMHPKNSNKSTAHSVRNSKA